MYTLKLFSKKSSLFVAIAILVQMFFCTQVFSAEDVNVDEVDNSLPIGWQSKDIGRVGLAGNSTFNDYITSTDKFTLSGSGEGIKGTDDSFHFAYQKLSGNFSIEAEPNIFRMNGQKGYVGIMIRDDLYSDAAFVGLFVTKDNKVEVQSRKKWNVGAKTEFSQSQEPDVSSSYGLKLVRNGDKIVCMLNAGGEVWNQIGEPIKIDIGKEVYAGLCITSEDRSVAAQCEFAYVGVQTANSVFTIPYVSNAVNEDINQVNLAQGKTIVSASQKAENPATNAIDGKTSTVWSIDGAPHSFIVDLGDTFDISSFETILPKKQALKYKIETATESGYYILVADNTTSTKASKNFENDIKSVLARYVKLTVVGINNSTNQQINIGEFKVMGSSEPVSIKLFSIFNTRFVSNPVIDSRKPDYEAIECGRYATSRSDRALSFGPNSSFLKEFSTEGYSDIIISFRRWTENCEMDESFITEWFDGDKWEKLEEVKGNIYKYGFDDYKAFVLPETASNNKNCKVRIRTENYDSNDKAFLDDISIEGKYISAPLAPENLHAQSITDNSAVVEWDEFKDCLYMCHYDIYLEDGTKLGSARDTRFLIDNLDKGKEYKVYVKAVNTANISSIASDTITIKTPDSSSNETVYYEAEAGEFYGAVRVVDDSACSGGKKVIKDGNLGWSGTLDMNIHCETSGSYVLTFYYYSTDIDFHRVSINGLGVETFSDMFLNGTYDYLVQRSFTVELNAGDNTLSIYDPSFLNDNAIDRVAITPFIGQ